MEFSWGYAAARASPYPSSYYRNGQSLLSPATTTAAAGTAASEFQGREGLSATTSHDEHNGQKEHGDPHFYTSIVRPNRKAARSNSISGLKPSKKQPRFFGHTRTSSSGSRSQSSNDTVLQHYVDHEDHELDLDEALGRTNSVQTNGSTDLPAATPSGFRFTRRGHAYTFPGINSAGGQQQTDPSSPVGAGTYTGSVTGEKQQHAAMFADHPLYSNKNMPAAPGVTSNYTIPTGSSSTAATRAESLNSTSANSGRTMLSNEPPSGAESNAMQARPFVVRNGRSYMADATLHYPLPVDLAELHRQSLRTLMMFQLFGGPICSPVFANRPPTRVLEVGCGSAFWSMMCHRYYARQGHTNISFTGLDVAPIAPGASGQGTTTTTSNRTSSSSTSGRDGRPDKDMRWRFVQHDMRKLPWPFADGEFDLVMVKDVSLATPLAMQQTLMDEYVRVLRPGGVIEIWESDYTLRMLRPHVPEGGGGLSQAKRPRDTSTHDDEDEEEETDESESEQDEHQEAANHGAYLMTSNTPLSGPLNNFIVEYNGWVSKALEARSLSAVPCTLIGALLRQEVDTLTGVQSKRLAVPLSEVRWEREGVGGVVTKDGKSYIETKGRLRSEAEAGKTTSSRPLGASQAAVRRTALLTVVQQIQSLEAVLREVSGKSQDEWDGWCGKMMNDLLRENGTSWGECLEVGAWWSRKKV